MGSAEFVASSATGALLYQADGYRGSVTVGGTVATLLLKPFTSVRLTIQTGFDAVMRIVGGRPAEASRAFGRESW